MTAPAATDAARAIIAATDTALAELEAVLEGAERVTLHGDDQHDWTEADVWAHLGRWFAASVDVVKRYQGGEREIDDYDDGERLNLGWLEADRGLAGDEAKARALDTWAEFRALLAAVEPSEWNGLFEGYARGTGVGHVLEHIGFVVDASGVEPPAEAVSRLSRDRTSWSELVAALDARPGVPLHDPESPEWTSKEIFGHFAHWTEWGITAFEAMRDGQPRPEANETFEEANARWAAEDGAHDLETLRARALRAQGRRAQLIRSTPAEQWTEEMVAAIDEDGYDHIAEHHRYIGGESSA